MGTVYLALDQKHGRRVAIKVLPPELGAAIGADRFLREIEIAARLSHPHILALHDSGTAQGFLYYVMPYVEGESLGQASARGPLPVADVIQIGREIASALGAAHAAGVIHRDVKPTNILLAGYPRPTGSTQDWHALLADFGVARAVSPGTSEIDRLTATGAPVGTLAYASPEQAAGSPAIDGKSDVYSFGCVLFESLLGNRPGDPAGAARLLERRFAEPLPAPSTLVPNVPPWLDRLVTRAVAPNPADRMSADELRRGIEEAERGAPAIARSRRLAPATLLAAGLGVVVTLGAGLLYRARPAPDPKRVLVAAFENRTGDRSLDLIGDIATDYVARGLATTRLLHGVFDGRVEGRAQGRSSPDARVLARGVGAGTLVLGRYYLSADTLRFEAQILNASTGTVILAPEPAAAPAGQRTRAVELLRQRIMAGFGIVFGKAFEPWDAVAVPPTYDAYVEMIRGNDALWRLDFMDAAGRFLTAARLDSTYAGAKASAAYAMSFAGECRIADSIGRLLEPSISSLSPTERGRLEYAAAQCRRDTEGMLAADRAVLQSSPGAVEAAILANIHLQELGRPKAALAAFRDFDPERPGLSDEPVRFYWDFLALTHHQLGEFGQQLRASEDGLRRLPENAHLRLDRATALAGLGRHAEVTALTDRWLQETSKNALSPGMMSSCAALELVAHGSPAAAASIFDRVVRWYQEHAPDELTAVGDTPCLIFELGPYYLAGQWDSAWAGYSRALAIDTGSTAVHGALGAIALRRGDRAAAERMADWLRRRSESSSAKWRVTFERARLFAVGRQPDSATRLLRRAFDQGATGIRLWIHFNSDFQSLKGYGPFEQFLHPPEP